MSWKIQIIYNKFLGKNMEGVGGSWKGEWEVLVLINFWWKWGFRLNFVMVHIPWWLLSLSAFYISAYHLHFVCSTASYHIVVYCTVADHLLSSCVSPSEVAVWFFWSHIWQSSWAITLYTLYCHVMPFLCLDCFEGVKANICYFCLYSY